jgi:hypothetical protein
VALDVDTGVPLRRPAELVRLIRAILDADPNDETDWLEWKSRLGLTSAAGRFPIAKGILGLANRIPTRAQANCGGIGYVVIGAEPGSVTGVLAVDPAQLDDGLSPYVGGARGPGWSATYVQVDGSSVLVVMVEAPKAGDPIYTLRKTYDNFRAGTVFTRKNGKTAPADDHDIDALQARLRARSSAALELDVSIVGDIPLSWFDPGRVEPEIQQWVESRRSGLVAEAERIDRLQRQEGTVSDDPLLEAHRLATSLTRWTAVPNPLVREDDRTLDDYAAEVEAWAERLLRSVMESWPARYSNRGHGVMRVKVVNSTDRNLQDVLVKVVFPGEEIGGVDESPYVNRLPSPPRRFGEPERLDLGLLGPPIGLPNLSPGSSLPEIRSTWVEQGSLRIGWEVGDLRPRETDESEDVYAFVRGPLADGSLKGVWEATSKSTDGLLKGELSVPLAEHPVGVVSVLEASDGD